MMCIVLVLNYLLPVYILWNHLPHLSNIHPREDCTPGHFKLTCGAFRHWKLDLLKFPPPHLYVLVVISMISHWTKASLCRQATATSVAKVLLEKVFPIWETHLKLHNDQGTHFTGQLLQQVCTVWLVLQHFHCSYHPQSSGLVKCINDIIKSHLARFVEALQLSWLKTLS